MLKRGYTVLVVSRGKGSPIALQISLRSVCAVLAIFFAFAGGVAWLYRSHGALSGEVARLAAVEAENQEHRARLAQLENEIDLLLEQVHLLDELGREMREIVTGGSGGHDMPRLVLQSRSGTRVAGTIDETVDYLMQMLPRQAEEMTVLLAEAGRYRARLDATPDFWPVTGRVTSPFGWRRAPLSLRRHFHNGIDVGVPSGTPVRAAADGVVREARYRAGWGNLIIVCHGEHTTYYAHLRRMGVRAGQAVRKGQQIGEVGTTGYSTGPHLHFETHENGTPVNPLKYLGQEVRAGGI
jgi:septal ring factor EnvC (AmiA/AmiB activator)